MGELSCAEFTTTVTLAPLASNCTFGTLLSLDLLLSCKIAPKSVIYMQLSQLSACAQVLLFYPDGKKSSSTEGHLAPPGLPAPGAGNAGGNQQGGGQGQVLHLPIPPGPIPGNANGTPPTSYVCTFIKLQPTILSAAARFNMEAPCLYLQHR